jgi:peptidyl-tRNA hydrolase, PTH1 family
VSKYLIAGLGNPGDEYANTRHNIGFDVVNELATELNATWKSDRLAQVAQGKYKGRSVIMIKPSTYMNLSGDAIRYWLGAEKIPIEHLMVIIDELALPFGTIRLNPKGSDGGHNGLKSIQQCLGTSVYPRLRFGIGNERGKGYNANYVLGEWNEQEKAAKQERVKMASAAVCAFVFTGLQLASNQFNGK